MTPNRWFAELAAWWAALNPTPLTVKHSGLVVVMPDQRLVLRQLETLGCVPRATLSFDTIDGQIASMDHAPLLRDLVPILEARGYWVSFQRKHPHHPTRLLISPDLKRWFDDDLDVEATRAEAVAV